MKDRFKEMFNRLFGDKPSDVVPDIKQPRFHIAIKDNETGATLHDADTSCILGAFDSGDATAIVKIAACDTAHLAATTAGALNAVDDIIAKNPFIKLLVEIARSNKE